MNLAEKYLTQKAELDRLKKEVEATKNELLAMMDEAHVTRLIIGDLEVSNREVIRMAFDSKAFRADFDDVYNEYKKPQIVHYFNVTAA